MPDSDPPLLRLGTRASALARWQADWVAGKMKENGHAVEVVLIRTQGDAQQAGPIAAIGSQGVFTKELQRALLEDQIDLAVHSMKDLPTTVPGGLTVAAVPPREAVHDALVSNSAASIDDLPHKAVVGTGSARRRAQLLAYRSDLEVRDLRGNVGTRLDKLDQGDYDAILLAEAGLRRLGLGKRITQLLPFDILLPAPAQGALAVECRERDSRTLKALSPLDDPGARAAVTAERTALQKLEGGCLAAMGAHAEVHSEGLKLLAVVLSEDGAERAFAEGQGALSSAEELGQTVAADLLARGAAKLLRNRPQG